MNSLVTRLDDATEARHARGMNEVTDNERVAQAVAATVLALLDRLDPDARRAFLLALARLLAAHRGGEPAGALRGVDH